jgi:hypothetical protein
LFSAIYIDVNNITLENKEKNMNMNVGFNANQLGFGNFKMKDLRQQLNEAKKIDAGVGIVEDAGYDNKRRVDFVVTDILEKNKEDSFKHEGKTLTPQRIKGYYLENGPYDKSINNLFVDKNGEVYFKNIVRIVYPAESNGRCH